MEEQEGDMDPHRKGAEEIERRSQDREFLTIMIFRELGKVRRFTISSRLLLCTSLFLLFYTVATIYFTNKYFDARRVQKIQADKIANLTRKLVKTTRDLERSRRHTALLDEYISESRDQGAEPESSVNPTEPPLPRTVDIEDLKIRRDDRTVDVTFRIVNRQSDEGPVGGYIFVLASAADSDESEVWVYPSSPLKDGLPADYSKGQRFLIERFKTVSSQYTLGKSVNKPLVLKILVYDRNGTLILTKVVQV
jgi:hypothetical protein